MARISRRQTLVLGGAAAFLAACSSGSEDPKETGSATTAPGAGTAAAQATPQPKPGGVLRLRRISQETHLSIAHSPWPDSQAFMYETMYDLLWTPVTGGTIKLLLAGKVETPDPVTFITTLRPATFHGKPPVNGREVVAEDVKLTLDFFTAEIPNGAVNQGYVKDEVTYTVVDPRTIRFAIQKPSAYFYEASGPGKVVLARETFATIKAADPVGSGPFQYKSRTAGSVMEVERFAAFRGQPEPYLAGVTSTVIKDDATAEASFIAGNIDLFNPPEFQTAERIKRQMGTKVTIDERQAVDGSALAMNMHRPDSPFKDERVRKAFYRAVNRQNLINVIAFGKASLTGPVSPGIEEVALTEDEVRPYMKYDPNEAKQLLQQAGFPFDRTYEIAVGDSEEANSTAQLIVEDLKAVGVKAAVKPYPAAEIPARTYARGGSWDMAMRSLGGANLPRLFRIQHSDPRIVILGDGFAQPEIDKLIEDAEIKPDQESRNKAWKSLQKSFLDRATPLMPLFSRRVFIGYQSYVKGYDTSPRAGAKWIAPIWLDK